MILANNGEVRAQGKMIDLLAELSSIVSALHNNLSKHTSPDFSKRNIRHAIDMGLDEVAAERDISNDVREIIRECDKILDEIEELERIRNGNSK